MPQTEEARSKPLVGNTRVLDLGLIGGAAESLSRREWVEQGRMCSLFSAELESQSGSERVEARSDQTPEFRLFESASRAEQPCLAWRSASSPRGIRWRQAGWMPWTPYADWIFTLVSTGSMLLIVWLVLRPRP